MAAAGPVSLLHVPWQDLAFIAAPKDLLCPHTYTAGNIGDLTPWGLKFDPGQRNPVDKFSFFSLPCSWNIHSNFKQALWKMPCDTEHSAYFKIVASSGIALHFLSFSLLLPFSFIPVIGESEQLCLTLCNPMDCSLPGSSGHGIFQARTLEWIAISFSTGSSWPKDQTCSLPQSLQADSLPSEPLENPKSFIPASLKLHLLGNAVFSREAKLRSCCSPIHQLWEGGEISGTLWKIAFVGHWKENSLLICVNCTSCLVSKSVLTPSCISCYQ